MALEDNWRLLYYYTEKEVKSAPGISVVCHPIAIGFEFFSFRAVL
jgi:hypothetical protein